MNERVAAIRKFAEEEEKKKQQEILAKEERIENYKNQILALKPRIDELLEVGNACLQSNIRLSVEYYRCTESYENRQFVTNGISHLLGFVRKGKEPLSRIGIEGGGACNFNLETDGKEIIVSGNEEYVLKRFVDEFDVFEKAFYDYVDDYIATEV